MAIFCLIPKYAEKFKDAIRSGEINPDKLIAMSSDERRAYLEKFVGEFNARGANILFEEKLLLKNQQMGIINWAKKLSGINEKYRTDILDKVERLDKALNPQTENGFLSDIVEQRLGVKVTQEEAQIITDLTAKARQLYEPGKTNFEQSKGFWQAKQRLLSYMREIKPESNPLTKLGVAKKALTSVLSIGRAIKTGFDLSAALRQGASMFGTKQWNQAFVNMFRYAGSKAALDDLEVSMLSSKYSEQVIANKRTLGLTMLGETFTQREEQFGSKLISKIPLLQGSERAYTGFLNDLRFNRFVSILENLDKSGVGITDNKVAMQDLAKVIAAATGRGSLGVAEGAAESLATVLFSPRWMASRVELILNPLTKTGPARVEAIKDLARLSGIAVAVLALAKASGARVEMNPVSSDFGSFRVGKTKFDMTGGLSAYITLVARGVEGKTKSSTNGRIMNLNTGKFGSLTYLDVIENFVEGKTAPLASVIRDIFQGQTYGGQKVKVGFTKDFAEYLGTQLFQPMLSSDGITAYQEASDGAKLSTGAAATFASLFGIGVNTQK